MVVKAVQSIFEVIQLSAEPPNDELTVFFRHQLMDTLRNTDGARLTSPQKSRSSVDPGSENIFPHAIDISDMQGDSMQVGILIPVSRELGLKILRGGQGPMCTRKVNQETVSGVFQDLSTVLFAGFFNHQKVFAEDLEVGFFRTKHLPGKRNCIRQ